MKTPDKDDAIVVAVTPRRSLYMGNSKIRRNKSPARSMNQISNKLDRLFRQERCRAPLRRRRSAVWPKSSAGVDNSGC